MRRIRLAAALAVAVLPTIVADSGAADAAVTPRAVPVVYRGGPPPRRTVLLSRIERIEEPVGSGPALGRPPLPRDAAAFTIPTVDAARVLEREIGAAVNAVRFERRLPPLRRAAPLTRAAEAHARALALAGAFTHDWPLAPRAPFSLWIERYYRVVAGRRWSAGENLLWADGALTGAQAAAMWLNSPSHRRILLSAHWRELGIGVVYAQRAGGVFAGRDVYVVAAEFGLR